MDHAFKPKEEKKEDNNGNYDQSPYRAVAGRILFGNFF
jgi:hypothetical protein